MHEVSIEETLDAMGDIAYGNRYPSVKLAFWSSALSIQMRLSWNCKYTRIMAQFVDQPLPDRETLLDLLGRREGKRFPAGMHEGHLNTLYAIETLYEDGELYFPGSCDLASQQDWRNHMVELIPGMACKTVSWAFFIYDPQRCKLLTVDVWHCRRLGIDQSSIAGKSACKQQAYFEAEALMLNECLGLYPDYPPVITAAMLWTNIRIAAHATKEVETVESHAGLSCRWY